MESPEKKPRKWERTNVTNLLRNRESGKYYARVKVGGKQKWRSLDTTVATVAKLRLPAAQEAMREQEQAASGRMANTGTDPADQFKVSRFVAFYTSGVENKRKLAPASKARIKDSIKTLLRTWPELPDCDVRRLRPADCLAWANRVLTQESGFVAPNAKTKRPGMSASGFNKCTDSLRNILEVAKKEGALHRNPANEIEKEKPRKKVLELPTMEQFRTIVELVRTAGSRWSWDAADLVRLLAYSGARLREGTRMQWSHVDEAKGLMTIPGTKSDASRDRLVPLFPPLRGLLGEIRARRGPERSEAPIARVNACMDSLKNACRKVGVQPMDHHDLRHLFATRCIEAGVDIPTVAKWLGHADGGVLAMKTYGHLRQEHSLAQGAKVVF